MGGGGRGEGNPWTQIIIQHVYYVTPSIRVSAREDKMQNHVKNTCTITGFTLAFTVKERGKYLRSLPGIEEQFSTRFSRITLHSITIINKEINNWKMRVMEGEETVVMENE